MPILLALTALGVTGIFGLERLTSKTDTAIETTGDFVSEKILPAFFFGVLFRIYIVGYMSNQCKFQVRMYHN